MRVFLISAWLFVGMAGLIFHLGPGRELEKQDQVNHVLTQAKLDVSQQRWDQAIDHYSQALDILPTQQKATAYRLRLEKSKAQMMASQLPEARLALESLLSEIENDVELPEADRSSITQDTRQSLASSQYYVTWLMRLEGLGREEWEPEIEASRQHYRLLVEQAEQNGDTELLQQRKEDLEASIRLARMDLSELQALPLPSQCCNCQSGKCRKKGKRPSQKQEPNTGASFSNPGEGDGS